MENERFFSKDAWRGVIIAIALVGVGQAALAWQYYRLEGQRLPVIEQQLAEQKEALEKSQAQETLKAFLTSWQLGQEDLAKRYLTENAVVQLERQERSLKEGFLSFEIIRAEKTQEGFRFQAAVEENTGLPPRVEIILVVEILDSYFVDSLDIAG